MAEWRQWRGCAHAESHSAGSLSWWQNRLAVVSRSAWHHCMQTHPVILRSCLMKRLQSLILLKHILRRSAQWLEQMPARGSSDWCIWLECNQICEYWDRGGIYAVHFIYSG